MHCQFGCPHTLITTGNSSSSTQHPLRCCNTTGELSNLFTVLVLNYMADPVNACLLLQGGSCSGPDWNPVQNGPAGTAPGCVVHPRCCFLCSSAVPCCSTSRCDQQQRSSGQVSTYRCGVDLLRYVLYYVTQLLGPALLLRSSASQVSPCQVWYVLSTLVHLALHTQ